MAKKKVEPKKADAKKKVGPRQMQLPDMVAKLADLEAAQKKLEDESEAKRARSSMKFWLESKGLYDAYNTQGTSEKRKFPEQRFADRMIAKCADKRQKLVESNEKRGIRQKAFEWMNKHKAIAKLASGKLEAQADPYAGLNDDDNCEYKV